MNNDVKFVLAAGLFITMFFSVMPGLQVLPGFQQSAPAAEDPVGVARFMFGPFAVPLILLSTVLLVALVGALVLARPDDEPATEEAWEGRP